MTLSYRFLSKRDSADMHLTCKDGGVFQCHSQMLAARSEVFAAMLSSDMKEKKLGQVDMADMDTHIVQALIEWIYSDSCSCLEQEAFNLFVVADKYMLHGLKNKCEWILRK